MDPSLQQAMMLQAIATQQGQGAINQGQNNAINALNTGQTAATGAINAAVPQQTGALQQGYNTATGALNTGLNNSLTALGQGYNQATGAVNTNYGQARGDALGSAAAYAPYAATGQNANAMYSNALGLNGASGNAAATGAFQAGPGYEWQVNQALDAALRKQNAAGMLGSGNTLTALATLGSNLANQEYQQWLQNLFGLSGQGLTAAQGQQQAGLAAARLAAEKGNALAGLSSDYGKNQANAYDAYGTRNADLATGLGSSLSNVYGGQGSALANIAQTGGQNQASVYSNAANNAATLGMEGARNSLNLLGQQSEIDWQREQRPWMLASGALNAAAGVGSAYAGRR